jgi:hypothetical protein
MPEFPNLNYRSIHLFLLSFYGILFILSLTGVLKIANPNAMLWGSFINIVISLLAWLGDMAAYHSLASKYAPMDSDNKSYREGRIIIFFLAILFTSLVMLIVLMVQ